MPRNLTYPERKNITEEIKAALAKRSVIWDDKDVDKLVKTLKRP